MSLLKEIISFAACGVIMVNMVITPATSYTGEMEEVSEKLVCIDALDWEI